MLRTLFSLIRFPTVTERCSLTAPHLLVDFGEVLQVLLQEADALLLGHAAQPLLALQLCTLNQAEHNPNITRYSASREVGVRLRGTWV